MKLNPKDVHLALKMWNKASLKHSPIEHLFLFQKRRREGCGIGRATTQVIVHALEVLQVSSPQKAELLRQHFIDGVPVFEIASQFNVSQTTIYKRQKQAIAYLAEVLSEMEYKATAFPGHEEKPIVEEQEVSPMIENKATALPRKNLEERLLLPSYLNLVGVSEALDLLKEVLILPEPPWIVSIEGIGGIGKTSLADALVRQLIEQGLFDDFAWMSTQRLTFSLGGTIESLVRPALTVDDLVDCLLKQLLGLSSAQLSDKQAFNTLKYKLKERPHLIVIDNLETLPDISTLLPILRHLANPSQFLLTSRKSLYASPHIYHFIIPELSQANALQLVREEAHRRHLPHLIEAEDKALLPIYDTVGGNPLALRLIVGQTHIEPLEVILSDLKTACGETVQNLYTYIYRAAWDNLDEVTRRAFLSLPLAQKGGSDFAHLEAVSALGASELRHALNLLISLNLVDLVGKLGQRRYTIHQLTRTFLEQQVADWQ